MNSLSAYGWTPELDALWKSSGVIGAQPARVVADFGTSLKIATPDIITAELSGKLAHFASRQDAPKVGDWVAVRISSNDNAVVEAVLPRRSEIARKVAGNQTAKQVIAANIDVAFVLLAVGNDFNLDRLRRFLYQLSISNITPVIVLNKADIANELEVYITQLKSFELPIITTVATKGVGIADMLQYIQPGKTAALLGSSGVGKSTITNQLLGKAVQKTQTVRKSDETGRHTTVHRELFMLPNGGLLVDMPGIRELQLWGTEENLAGTYDDITALARQCKYTTCHHGLEDGCAVQRALRDGTLEPLRYAAYQKMKSELEVLARRAATLQKRQSEKAKRVAVKKQHHDSIKDMRSGINE